jgi:hypothetical protein
MLLVFLISMRAQHRRDQGSRVGMSSIIQKMTYMLRRSRETDWLFSLRP